MKNVLITLAAASLLLSACASKDVQKSSLSENANIETELKKSQDRLAKDQQQQMDVAAPGYFFKAEDRLKEAVELRQKGKSDEKVKAEIEWANGNLDRAEQVASETATALAPVLNARQAAVTARAPEFQNKEFVAADHKLKGMTEDFRPGEIKFDTQKISEAQGTYLAIELNSIKADKLGEARSRINMAEKQNAAKYAPQTLASAKLRLSDAEKTIETDRHNQDMVKQASTAATMEARKLSEVVRLAQGAKKGEPEAVALTMYDKSAELNSTNKELKMTEQEKADLEKSMAEKNAEAQSESNRMNTAIVDLKDQNQKLSNEKAFNDAIEKARTEFNTSEADVYRQGNNLIIRLKSMNFSKSRSELPAPAIASLKKVKDVISELDAQKVVVQGHTDSTGTAMINKEISQKRADAVKNYLVTEGVVAENKVDAIGEGYDKPISSNKTAEGRRQNRRVDIVVTPNSTSL